MAAAWNIAKVLLAATIIVIVGEISRRSPRAGALLLSLPLVSLLALLFAWQQHHDLKSLSQLARDTLILVPLGLPFFVPLAFAQRLGMGVWSAFASGVLLACSSIGLWFTFAPCE
jgi:hypothetical protein